MSAAKPSASPAPGPTAQERQVLINAARKEAHAFRGSLLDQFAQLERHLGPVLVHASTLTAYAAIVKKPAHLLGQKLEQLHKLTTEKGPLEGSLNKMTAEIDALRRYEEMRHFMAHATLEVVQAESGDFHYLFRLARLGQGNLEDSTIVLSKAEAKSTATQLGNIVDALTKKLDAACNSFRPAPARLARGSTARPCK